MRWREDGHEAMNDEQTLKSPNTSRGDGRWMESGWKYGRKMDVGGKKKLEEKRGEEGIYMLNLGSEAGGPSILGKVGCPEKGKYHPPQVS